MTFFASAIILLAVVLMVRHWERQAGHERREERQRRLRTEEDEFRRAEVHRRVDECVGACHKISVELSELGYELNESIWRWSQRILNSASDSPIVPPLAAQHAQLARLLRGCLYTPDEYEPSGYRLAEGDDFGQPRLRVFGAPHEGQQAALLDIDRALRVLEPQYLGLSDLIVEGLALIGELKARCNDVERLSSPPDVARAHVFKELQRSISSAADTRSRLAVRVAQIRETYQSRELNHAYNGLDDRYPDPDEEELDRQSEIARHAADILRAALESGRAVNDHADLSAIKEWVLQHDLLDAVEWDRETWCLSLRWPTIFAGLAGLGPILLSKAGDGVCVTRLPEDAIQHDS